MSVKTLLTHFCGYYFIAVEPFPRMHVFKLDRYINNDYMYFVMAIEIISALAFVIFYTVKEVKKIKEQGKKYFKVLIYLFLIVLIIITIQLKKAGCICT